MMLLNCHISYYGKQKSVQAKDTNKGETAYTYISTCLKF